MIGSLPRKEKIKRKKFKILANARTGSIWRKYGWRQCHISGREIKSDSILIYLLLEVKKKQLQLQTTFSAVFVPACFFFFNIWGAVAAVWKIELESNVTCISIQFLPICLPMTEFWSVRSNISSATLPGKQKSKKIFGSQISNLRGCRLSTSFVKTKKKTLASSFEQNSHFFIAIAKL